MAACHGKRPSVQADEFTCEMYTKPWGMTVSANSISRFHRYPKLYKAADKLAMLPSRDER